jgi:Spy/CpxP family protein refolding chaperone
MTETSRRVGLFLGAGMVIAAATLVTHAADQNSSGGPGSLVAQAGGPGEPGAGFQGGPGPGRGRQGGPMGRGMGPGGPGMPEIPGIPGIPGIIDLPLGRLGLNGQQQDQVQAIMQSHQDEMKGLGDRAMAARDALEAAVSADTIDENAIRSRAADVAVVDADMAVARAHVRGEVLQVLTAEQRAQAKQMQAEMQAARPPRPGRGGRAGQ